MESHRELCRFFLQWALYGPPLHRGMFDWILIFRLSAVYVWRCAVCADNEVHFVLFHIRTKHFRNIHNYDVHSINERSLLLNWAKYSIAIERGKTKNGNPNTDRQTAHTSCIAPAVLKHTFPGPGHINMSSLQINCRFRNKPSSTMLWAYAESNMRCHIAHSSY